MQKYKIIGHSYPKIEDMDCVTGRIRFIEDLVPNGALFGQIVRSPYPKARVVSIDTTAAEANPDVRAIITPFNTPSVKYGVMVRDENVLTLEPCYIGDEVAAVAAVSINAARQAVKEITVQYEELPAVFDVGEAMAEGAVSAHKEAGNIPHRVEVCTGDASEALKSSAATVKMEVQTNYQLQASLEHFACLASWSDVEGLVFQGPVQDPATVHTNLAYVLGLPMSKVRVIQTRIGGGYGSKVLHVKLIYICSLLALKSRQTVYMMNSTAEELTAGRPRVPARLEVELGADDKGMLTVQRNRIYADNGAYCSYAPGPVNVMATRTNILYRTPVLDTKAFLVYTNKVPTAGMRGFGNISMLFALEQAVDALARKLKVDPVEFRKKNIHKEGEISPLGWKVSSSRLADCLDAVGDDAARWRKELQSHKDDKKPRGIGIACGVHVSSNRTRAFDGACAAVRLNEDGSVTVSTGDGEMGQGIRTIKAMIAAEVLDIDLAKVHVAPVDTAFSPYGLGVFADRGTTISGKAVQLAAEDARLKALNIAGEMMKVDPAELKLVEGMVISPDGQEVPLAKVANYAIWRPNGEVIIGRASYDPNTIPLDPRNSMHGNPSTGFTFCAMATEVEIDRATGEINVIRISTAHDSGKIINPRQAEGQIQGGVICGLGYALMEGYCVKDGEILTRNMRDYKLPTFMDLPEISIRFMESYEATGPFGAKGIGQTGALLVAPTIANAVYDAVGIRLTKLPMTSERVWQALNSGCKEGC